MCLLKEAANKKNNQSTASTQTEYSINVLNGLKKHIVICEYQTLTEYLLCWTLQSWIIGDQM